MSRLIAIVSASFVVSMTAGIVALGILVFDLPVVNERAAVFVAAVTGLVAFCLIEADR